MCQRPQCSSHCRRPFMLFISNSVTFVYMCVSVSTQSAFHSLRVEVILPYLAQSLVNYTLLCVSTQYALHSLRVKASLPYLAQLLVFSSFVCVSTQSAFHSLQVKALLPFLTQSFILAHLAYNKLNRFSQIKVRINELLIAPFLSLTTQINLNIRISPPVSATAQGPPAAYNKQGTPKNLNIQLSPPVYLKNRRKGRNLTSCSRTTTRETPPLGLSSTLVYVFYSLYLNICTATRGQQQRPPGGLTLSSSKQPTFGPGLVPRGIDWLITVTPATATFRSIHNLPTILYDLDPRNDLNYYDLASPFTLVAVTHDSPLSPISTCPTTIDKIHDTRLLPTTRRIKTNPHYPSQTPLDTSPIYLKETYFPIYRLDQLLHVLQFEFYYVMTTPQTNASQAELSSTSDETTSSSSDSDSDSGQESLPDTPASPPPPQEQSISPLQWYKPKRLFIPPCKYPVERNSDDPRKKKPNSSAKLPLVSTPRIIPLERTNPLPSDPRLSAKKPVHNPLWSAKPKQLVPHSNPEPPPKPNQTPF